MKVIFLDIDGVLNNYASKSLTPSGFLGVDDHKIKVLQSIVAQSQARLVLVSSWKSGWSIDPFLQSDDCAYLTRKLKRHGLHITAKTEDPSRYARGAGIRRFLREHPVESWVVLDDDIFDDYESNGILPHLVKTDFYRSGLTEDHIAPCLALLNQGV